MVLLFPLSCLSLCGGFGPFFAHPGCGTSSKDSEAHHQKKKTQAGAGKGIPNSGIKGRESHHGNARHHDPPSSANQLNDDGFPSCGS
mmetsp:Transcript_59902/g.177606  ORF Transcript_59902/g.177606 Transcript_59902/m.177606 type:complete len:87 (+) Transcript_59902:68-328(+)